MTKINWKLNTYQGWSNYYTWNIALYFNNDFSLYENIQIWKKLIEQKQVKKSYTSLIRFLGVQNKATLDGVKYNNSNIKKREILNAIFEE